MPSVGFDFQLAGRSRNQAKAEEKMFPPNKIHLLQFSGSFLMASSQVKSDLSVRPGDLAGGTLINLIG